MNLIQSPWLAFRQRDGGTVYAPPAAMVRPDIIDLNLPRADFNGAAWQFLLGLLQTAYAPRNGTAWLEHWHAPPDEARLQQAFAPFAPAFELFGDGARFMQDLDTLANARSTSIAALLIDAPGVQGIKQNTDFFVKRGLGEALCPSCSAHALMTMQTTGPAGGTGYRVGIRGGGPLTTLVLPPDADSTLWHKLWLNVLSRERLACVEPHPDDTTLFPWLAPTRTSEPKSTTPVTTPDDMHPLHAYWAMPNRLRLDSVDTNGGPCRVCGQHANTLATSVRITNFGANYDGPWRHPLTPYYFNPKKSSEPPISQKGQQGGIGYRHWEMFTLADTEDGSNLPASVINAYTGHKRQLLGMLDTTTPRWPRLWIFGYDMKQNKPRSWYSTHMPLVAVRPQARDNFQYNVKQLVDTAERSAKHVRDAIKRAWFGDGKPGGDLTFAPQRFRNLTRNAFFANLNELAAAAENGQTELPADLAERWYILLCKTAQAVFDEYVLAGDIEAGNLRRVMDERNTLNRKMRTDKLIKALHKPVQQETTA